MEKTIIFTATEITNQIHTIEQRIEALNHKYNFDTDSMPADEYIDYENMQAELARLKAKRDQIKNSSK